MANETNSNTIRLGGRAFRIVNWDARTVNHEFHMHRLVRTTGIDKVMPMDGETNAVYLMRLQAALIDSGRACDFIASFLLPPDQRESDWTPEMAREVARFVGALNTDADRDLVVQLCQEAVMGFFRLAIERFERSRLFSAPIAPPPPSNEPARLH